ncbi:MAG TPA: hypothetical protein VM451_06290 [Candidatus Limnocylindria bacterium]|nr:hypothetical protein [Candidatus Limnocylindria bacterium]
MARPPRAPNDTSDRPGQRPLLQGHLRTGNRTQGSEAPDAPTAVNESTGAAAPAEPATPDAGTSEAVKGKATKSPANVATRPHLEGSEQGPQ